MMQQYILKVILTLRIWGNCPTDPLESNSDHGKLGHRKKRCHSFLPQIHSNFPHWIILMKYSSCSCSRDELIFPIKGWSHERAKLRNFVQWTWQGSIPAYSSCYCWWLSCNYGKASLHMKPKQRRQNQENHKEMEQVFYLNYTWRLFSVLLLHLSFSHFELVPKVSW